jgi:hypothetical protein
MSALLAQDGKALECVRTYLLALLAAPGSGTIADGHLTSSETIRTRDKELFLSARACGACALCAFRCVNIAPKSLYR